MRYETIDHAWEDETRTRIVTASEPFSGYITGALLADTMLVLWTHNAALPRRPMVGVITGQVLRPETVVGQAQPRFAGVAGAEVMARDDLAQRRQARLFRAHGR